MIPIETNLKNLLRSFHQIGGNMSETNGRGFYFNSLVKYVQTHFDQNTQNTIFSQLANEHRPLISGVDRSGLVPMQAFYGILRGIEDQYSSEKEKLDGIIRCGQFVGEDATSTFLKLLVKVLTPSMFAMKFPQFWARYHDFGELVPDVSDIAKNHVRFHVRGVSGYRYITAMGIGWIGNAFRSMGKKDVVITPDPPGFLEGSEFTWHTRWS